MRTWLKDNGPIIGTLAGVIVAFVAVLQLVVAGPMNSRFDDLRSEMNQRFNDLRSEMNQRSNDFRSEMNQRSNDFRSEMNQRFDHQDKYMSSRFDAVDERLDRLETDVSELRTLSDRVSRSEGRIDQLAEQLQSAPTPSP